MNIGLNIGYRLPEKHRAMSHETLDGRSMWWDENKTVNMNSLPAGEFGKDWFTDADEILVYGGFVLFCYYYKKKRTYGDPVIFNNNGEVSIWRYGGGYKITPMTKEDLGL